MLRFKVGKLIAEKEFREKRKVTVAEVADGCSISRGTLRKICNVIGYNTGTETIDKLCDYFDCKIEDLVLHVPSNSSD